MGRGFVIVSVSFLDWGFQKPTITHQPDPEMRPPARFSHSDRDIVGVIVGVIVGCQH